MESENYPKFGLVLPDKRTKGINSFAEPGEIFKGRAESVASILNREYGGDAHFVVYHLRDDDGPYPRCNKPVLGEIRKAGDDLVSGWLVYDIDNPDHNEHTSPTHAREMFEGLCQMEPRPHAVYMTLHGARIMYALQHPVSVDTIEEMLPGFAETIPVDVDTAAFDWTRLFRAPKATRAHSQQWVAPWFQIHIDHNTPLLVVADVPRKAKSGPDSRERLREVDLNYGGRPEKQTAFDLMEDIEQEAPAILSEMSRHLRNRISHPILFGNTEMAPDNGPGRMNAIQSYVGDTCRWCYRIQGCTPQLVYAMYYIQGVASFLPDADTPSWPDELWAATCRYWGAEESKDEDPEATRSGPVDEIEEQQLTRLSLMGRGVAQWASDFPGRTSPEARKSWVQRHLIAVGIKGELHLLGPDGYFTNTTLDKTSLIPAMRDLGLDDVIPLEEISGKTLRPRPTDAILRHHGTHFGAKSLVVGIKDPQGRPSGRLAQMGTDTTVLEFSTFARKDYEPAYDEQVDEWMHLLVGDAYDELCRWIAWALAFEEGPICALGLYGPPGVGKQMLSRGLAECITTETHGTGDDFGRWSYGIIDSPFLFVNEGFPEGIGNVADTFRKLVDGERIRVEIKFQAPFMMSNPLRILLLSNNKDLIGQLAGGRDMSTDDRSAVAQRLSVHETSIKAKNMLHSRGGREYTKGWVAGDQPSDYRIARHFLHLHAKRNSYPKDARFLVEGTLSLDLDEIMLFTTGAAPTVVEAIIHAVESKNPMQAGIHISEGELWMTSAAIVDQCRKDAKNTLASKPFTLNQVGRIMRGLVVSGGHSVMRRIGDLKSRWHVVDTKRLVTFAEEYGLPHQELDKILKGEPTTPSPVALLRKAQ